MDRAPRAASRAWGQAETLDLRAFRYAAAAARHGNLAAAAREFGVTASAISQQLRKLEDELGLALLIRHGRGVTATPTGLSLLERMDAVSRLLAAPLESAGEAIAPEGAVSVTLPTELAAVLAGPLAARVRRAWPAVTLALRECAAGEAESWLLRGETDIAVVQDQAEISGLSVERVAVEALGLIAAPREALGRASSPLRLRDLGGVPLVLPNPRHWIRRLLARAAFQRGVALDVAFQADGLAVLKDMVRTGLGCGVVPAASVREETARGALVFRPLEQPALAATHAVATRDTASAAVRAIAAAIGQAMRALAATEAWTGTAAIEAAPASAQAEPDATAGAWHLPRTELRQAEAADMEGD